MRADMGNRIMAANAQAWNATYSDPAETEEPITARDVERECVRKTVETMSRGMHTLRGLYRVHECFRGGRDMSEGTMKLRCNDCGALIATIGLIVVPMVGLCKACWRKRTRRVDDEGRCLRAR